AGPEDRSAQRTLRKADRSGRFGITPGVRKPMSIDSPWAGLASTVQRRLSARWRRHTGAETPAPATVTQSPPPAASQPEPEPDPFAEEGRAFLYQKIVERYGEGEPANKYLKNDINHMRRYVTSLKWVPEGEGRVIDPAAGGGLFPALLRHFRRCE